MRKYLAEGLGTYALVFCGTGAIIINDVTNGTIGHGGIAMAFGLIVMIMIFGIGHISGAHINPAVSIGFSLTDRYNSKDLAPYITAQLSGAVLASGTLKLLFPEHETLGATLPLNNWHQAFMLEVILTYFLMLIILLVSQNKATQSIAAVVIGGTVWLEALFAGPISGASMNPARSIGPALISGQMGLVWIYILAPILGAILATITWKILQPTAESTLHTAP